MNTWLGLLIFWCMAAEPAPTLVQPAPTAPVVKEPWWEKPTYRERIRQQRQVIISVKRDPEKTKHDHLMTGAGVVRATQAFTLQKILDFKELPKISSYFKKIVHQPELNRVYLVLEAYNYEARMLIMYTVETVGDRRIFNWKVVWGGFQGMIGSIELTSLEPEKTEVIMRSSFDDKEIPLPSIFTGFVLEILVQHVAKSMRDYVEDAYKNSKGAGGKI